MANLVIMESYRKVYIVDDDDDDVYILQEVLNGLRLKPVVFRDGEELLDSLRTAEAPKVIILDYHLPLANAKDILRKIQDLAIEKRPKVLVWSNYLSENEKLACLKEGADWYMDKPRSYRLVKSKLDRILTDWLNVEEDRS